MVACARTQRVLKQRPRSGVSRGTREPQGDKGKMGSQIPCPRDRNLPGRIIALRPDHANATSYGSSGDIGGGGCEQGRIEAYVPGVSRRYRLEPEERGGAAVRMRQGPKSDTKTLATITKTYRYWRDGRKPAKTASVLPRVFDPRKWLIRHSAVHAGTMDRFWHGTGQWTMLSAASFSRCPMIVARVSGLLGGCFAFR